MSDIDKAPALPARNWRRSKSIFMFYYSMMFLRRLATCCTPRVRLPLSLHRLVCNRAFGGSFVKHHGTARCGERKHVKSHGAVRVIFSAETESRGSSMSSPADRLRSPPDNARTRLVPT